MLFKKAKLPASRRKSQRSDLDKVNVARSFSYSSRRSEDKLNLGRNEAAGTPKNIVEIIKKIALLLGLLLFFYIIYKLTYVSASVIVKPISNSQIISSSEIDNYSSFTDSLIKNTFLNKNKITIDSSLIVNKLKAKYPQVLAASLSFNLSSNRPILYISESQGVLTLNTNNNQYYSVNLVGRSVVRALSLANLPNASSTPLVEDQSGLNVGLNQQVLPTSDVSFILTVTNELQAKSYSLSKFTLPAASRELDAFVKGQSYYIKFNLANNDPLQQVGTYLATIGQLKSQNVTPTKYVDVRVDGRAYYL